MMASIVNFNDESVIKIFDSIEDQASFFFLLLVTAIHNSKENRPISVALIRWIHPQEDI